MRNLVFGLVLLVSLSSCNKEETNKLENKMYPVQFNATGFTSESTSLKSETTESADRYYAVFDNEGNFVKEIRFAAEDQIKDVLLSGDYTAFMAVSSNSGFFNISSSNQTIENILFSTNAYLAEAYAGKVEFSVGENTESNIPIVLNRMSGRLEIVLEDEIPSKSTVTVNLTNVAYYLKTDNFNSVSHSNESFTYLNETEAAQIPTLGTDFMPIYTGEPSFENLSTLTMTCRDENDNILGIKTIENVKLERNVLTTLTGKLLSNDPNSKDSGFAVTFNEDWDSEINMTF